MVSKQEHKRKPKYVDDSCRKLSTVTRRADSVQFGKGTSEFTIARPHCNGEVNTKINWVTESIPKDDEKVHYTVRNLTKSK